MATRERLNNWQLTAVFAFMDNAGGVEVNISLSLDGARNNIGPPNVRVLFACRYIDSERSI